MTTTTEENEMTEAITYTDILIAANKALDNPLNPSAQSCVEDWLALHVAADGDCAGQAIAAAWLLRALEHEHGCYHPTTRFVGEWMSGTDHPMASTFDRLYGSKVTR